MKTLLLVLSLTLSGAVAPAIGGQDVEALLKRLESSDAQARDSAVTALAKLGPGALDAIAFQATLFLGSRFKKLNDEGKMFTDDPVLERILNDLGRALAAMGPAAIDPLAAWAISGQYTLEADLSFRALKIMGPRAKSAIPTLKAAMESDDSDFQWGGMVGLALVDGPDYPNLKEAFRSPNTDLRALAVNGFGKTGSPAVVDLVLAAASDEDMRVSGAANVAMRDLGPLLVPRIPQILSTEGMEFSVPFDMMGETAVSALKELFFERQSPVSDRAAVALARAGRSGLAVLAGALDHNDPAVRSAAVSALGEAESDKTLVADCLAKAWKDRDAAVRDAAMKSLYAAGNEGERLVPMFTAGLKDPSAPERLRSAMALAKLGRRAGISAPDLTAALADPSGGVRSAAAQALGLVRPDSSLAVPKLIPLASDADPAVRQGAIFALGIMEANPKIRKVLILAAEDTDPQVAAEAVMSLWGYESDSEAVLSTLLAAIMSERKEMNLAGLDVLSKWRKGFPARIKPLLETLRDGDPDPVIKDAAGKILRQLAPTEVDPSLPPPPPPPPPFPPPAPMFRKPAAGR